MRYKVNLASGWGFNHPTEAKFTSLQGLIIRWPVPVRVSTPAFAKRES
ncbi:MAG TPA: hypothetical protein PKA28_17185 [Methylomusa anaerophila]|nr:hypothetical protein [Methylomusa anaerophila]HML90177.1 hypothetical protein [Methylomusa anaerophila]